MKTRYKIISAILAALIVGGISAHIAVLVRTSKLSYEQTHETGCVQPTDNNEHSCSSADNDNIDIRIPDTKHKQPHVVIHEKLDIDVTDMVRNPNAEVVDSRIEYGTKEVNEENDN